MRVWTLSSVCCVKFPVHEINPKCTAATMSGIAKSVIWHSLTAATVSAPRYVKVVSSRGFFASAPSHTQASTSTSNLRLFTGKLL